jgi:hypothetical protein
MAAQPIDYAALAQQARQSAPKVDYAALAEQARQAPADVKQPPQGFFSSAADASGVSMLGNAIRHPLDTVQNIGNLIHASIVPGALNPDNPIAQGIGSMVSNTVDNVKQGVADYKATGLSDTTRRDLGRAVPIIGPTLAKAQGQYDAGNYAGTAGTIAGLVGGVAAPEGIINGVRAIPGIARGAIAGDVTKPIGVSGLTPLDRFTSAKSLGVNLDAADATNSTPLKIVKKVNENSLLGSSAYDAARTANTGALNTSTNDFLDSLSPTDREAGGKTIQSALQRNQQGLKTGAEQGFQQLTDETKGLPMQGSPAVGSKAQALLNAITPLADKYPSLAPGKTMNVLSDLSGVGSVPPVKPVMSGLLDESGNPLLSSTQPTPAKLDTFADLQKLRSATHDLTTTNPDLVKSQAIAPLQQMTSSLDGAMTDAANGLTPAQAQVFRDANAKWADMKGTYDDASSPLYHAVRSDAPSKLVSGDGLGPKTPEVLRDLKTRLGTDIAPLQRGVLEGALKPTADGVPNYKSFGLQLNRIPEDYRQELYSQPQQETIQHIANVSNVLGKDFNPSGSGKLGQGIAEGAALLHPSTMAIPLAQYPIAKMMNSPAVVDWLMKQNTPTPPNPLTLKAGIATAAGAPAAQLGMRIGSGDRQ